MSNGSGKFSLIGYPYPLTTPLRCIYIYIYVVLYTLGIDNDTNHLMWDTYNANHINQLPVI